MRRLLLLAVAGAAMLPASAAADAKHITLTRVAGTAPRNAMVDPERPQAEIAAYHPATDRIFATDTEDDTLDVYEHVLDPVLLARLPLDGGPNSVAMRPDGLVAVAVEADPKTDPGKVQFFRADSLAQVGEAPAGALPDMLTFTPDGASVLVANEGEPSDDYTEDPEGSVTVVEVSKSHQQAGALRPPTSTIRTSGSSAPARRRRRTSSRSTSRRTRTGGSRM